MKLVDQVSADWVFMIHPADFIASSKGMLSYICDFLSAAKTSEYLSGYVAMIYKVPKKSRDTLDWDEKYIKKVDALVEKYEFFNSYSRDT